MERLFSPWRSKYIETFSRPTTGKGDCVFCKAFHEKHDDENFVVVRGTTSFVIMNLFPYNSGHLMVVPNRHFPDIADLTEEETAEIMAFIKRMMAVLRSVSHPDGFNIGANVGRTAGAGIDQHVHIHIVPRWNGDTNFMPILADTKIISEDMKDQLQKLRKAL